MKSEFRMKNKEKMRTSNVQRPTSNVEVQRIVSFFYFDVGRWALDVRRSLCFIEVAAS